MYGIFSYIRLKKLPYSRENVGQYSHHMGHLGTNFPRYLIFVNMIATKAAAIAHQTFQVPKIEGTHLYKLYGYGLCKGKPTPKLAENKVQETLHFRYRTKFLVNSHSFFEAPAF